MMARQFDTGKNSECYRPIPVHTPSSRRLPSAKTYMNTNSETSTSPRYDTDYDYKTTHYPSYPSNYPYDDAKYKYEAQSSYNNYEKTTVYPSSYDDPSYDSRNYVSTSHPTNVATSSYPNDQEYVRYGNYESGRSSYPTTETLEYTEKTRYVSGGGGGGYVGSYERTYYDNEARYLSNDGRHPTEGRYTDSRHSDNRNAVDNRDGDLRYNADGRDNDRRYSADGRDEDGVRYTSDARDPDPRYSVEARGTDGRFNDTTRYQPKENYYDRYYKHRPSRDHHASETSRY